MREIAKEMAIGYRFSDIFIGDVVYLFPTALLGILVFVSLRQMSALKVPTVNSYPGDFARKRAHGAFISNAKGLLEEGIKRFNNEPFRIITTLGSRIILPSSWTLWVKNCHDLDHQELVQEEFFGDYPGMDGQAALHDSSHIVMDVIRTKLNQSSQCQRMYDHAGEAIDKAWTDNRDWHSVNFYHDITRIVGHTSASVFVGPELARNPEWQGLIVTYTISFFNAARTLRTWPSFIRPFVHWFLPEFKKAREQVHVARRLLQPVVEYRAAAKKEAEADGRVCRFYDTIEWIEQAAKGRPFDAAAAQLGLAMGAMHTTTELVKQTILDICCHSELIEPLRDEMRQAIGENGWTTAGLFKMKLLDSVLKETQRLKPGALVNLDRKALRDVVLPNGLVLPRGTHVAVECSMMSDASNYPDPTTYNGYRFLKLRESGNNSASLVSISPQHVAFGIGKSICPGRFMVANEAKVILARVLLDYEIRLAEDSERPRVSCLGFEMLCDSKARVEVRRR